MPRYKLNHYRDILKRKALPYFIAMFVWGVDLDRELLEWLRDDFAKDGDALQKVLTIHDFSCASYRKDEPWKSARPERSLQTGCISLFELKSLIAKKFARECVFCEHYCKVDRISAKGVCGVGHRARIASEFVHLGEEPEIVPSYTVFFSGCNFKCVYCQNWDIAMQPEAGAFLEKEALARRIEKAWTGGVRNVNFVGGNPDPNLHEILKTIGCLRVAIPIVWNSNMYASKETMKLLDGVADLYLGDFRYGNDDCAKELSSVSNYMSVVTRNFMEADRQASVIIRHLVLPGHLHCCTESVMKWVSENMSDAYFNLMFQYRPEHKARFYKNISRTLSYGEMDEAKKLAKHYGICVMD